jgi:glutamyl-tRNA reductase
MRYQLIGVNHKSAPLEVRERLAIPESRLPDTCRELAAHPGVEEGMIISTCNRVEMITHTTNGSADLRGFLHAHFHLTAEELDGHLYEFREKEAVRHLFRVASSLDSMVVGEAQILGRVKEAYATARAAGSVRGQLDQLFTRAFAVAKRVRSETAVGSSSVSIASVAVELAKKIFGTLQGKNVFIVGAGKMSELAARHLMAHGCASIFVANRTYDRAIGLAEKFNGQAIKFDDLYESCDRADIVITSTGAPHAIFRREHGEQFLARRKNRPMFFIDIAVPRDVSPEMAKLDGVFVYDIDDLQQAVSSHVADRSKEAELAEAIILTEVDNFKARFEARLQTRDVVPTIVSLQDHLETIRQAEIDRVRSRMGPLTPDQEMAVEALTRGIINKVMHTPITTLKTAAREAEATTVIEVVRRLFNLHDKEKGPASQTENKAPNKAELDRKEEPDKKEVESRH